MHLQIQLYGKTTTIKEHLIHAKATILWQKVYDSSASSLWYGFCHTLSKINPNLAHHLKELGLPNDSTSHHEALKLIKEMALPEKTVYAVDDYHLINKAGHWYMRNREYLKATEFFYHAGDFENILIAIERDKANSFGTEY